MASSLATTSTTTTTQEEEYFQRLCKLLIEEGTEVMRQEFDLIIPPANFPRILRQGRTTLTKLPRNVFTPTMDETLYSRAPISYGCSKHCDISLLMVLFRNLCRLNPPASTGNWTDMPSSNDCSLEADLVRLKLFRNELFAHTKKCSVQESEFQRHWTDISSVILRRGNHVGMVWTNKINDILTNPLSAHGKRWVENLKNWYLDDRDLKKMFGERIDLLREDLDLFKEEFNRKLQVNGTVSIRRINAKIMHMLAF